MSLFLLALQVIAAVLIPFFHVPLFGVLLVLISCDIVSGVGRSVAEGKYDPLRLHIGVWKAFLYIVSFIAIRVVSLYVPLVASLSLVELVLVPMIAKELISVLQNLKAIAILNDTDAGWIDAIIGFLKLNVYQAALDKLGPKNPAESEPTGEPESEPAPQETLKQ